MSRHACMAALLAALAACAGVKVVPVDQLAGVLPNQENAMPNPLSAPSHPSPPQVAPVEHAGVRYEQDTKRQSQPDAQRGGWLVARDAVSGAQLWSVQLYANPYDAASPVGSPPRWFTRMRLAAGGTALEIEDDIGTQFTVDIGTRGVSVRQSPSLSPTPRGEDKRPKFE